MGIRMRCPVWLVLIAVAAVLVQSCDAESEDILLLRDGSALRGSLSFCTEASCRLGAEDVPRAGIDWIGLGRDAPTPPPVRDPARDEVHLIDQSVQQGALAGIDPGTVRTAAGSFERTRVAWIHLAAPSSADQQGTQESEVAGPQPVTQDPPDSPAGDWHLADSIFIWKPPSCRTCKATLQVLHIKAMGGQIVVTKSRFIEASANSLSGSWYTYDPPVPLFPATTTVDWLREDSQSRGWMTEEYYVVRNARPSAGGGAAAPSATPPGPSATSADTATNPVDREIYEATDQVREAWQSWLRDRLARDAAAQQAGAPPPPQGGASQQFLLRWGPIGFMSYMRVTNWQAVAETYLRQGVTNADYERLKEIPVSDVEVQVKFTWRTYQGRGRDVDRDGYTTDRTVSPGVSREIPPDSSSASESEEAPPTDNPQGPIAQADRAIDEAASEALRNATAPVRERLAQDAADNSVIEPPPSPCGEAAAGGSAGGESGEGYDPLARVERELPEAVNEVLERAAAPIREAVARDRAARYARGFGRPTERTTVPCEDESEAGQPAHVLWLAMRWFRAEGRITPNNLADILQDAVQGQLDPASRPGFVIATSLPQGALDLETPPSWPSPNPRPPEPTPLFDTFRP